MRTLNVIGCGKVGRTLARLFHERGVFAIGDVCNRSLASAADAVRFAGAGRAIATPGDAGPADAWLVATTDTEVQPAAQAIAAGGALAQGDMVFHVSGALASSALAACADAGARVASVHPVKSFPDPAAAVAEFAGVFCGAEGDAGALDVLVPAFEAIGARVFRVDSARKALYHAGTMTVSGYVVALLEAGLRTLEHAGVVRDTAVEIIEPLVRGAVRDVFDLGTARALTGPYGRGDAAVIARHLAELAETDPQLASVYRALGRVSLDLARTQDLPHRGGLDEIARLLEK